MSEKRFANSGSWENWTHQFNRQVLKDLDHIEVPPGPVYDLGCYPGFLTRNLRRKYLHKREVIGFDILECDNIRNTVVCDVFHLPKQYDKPIAIVINELWHEDREALFEQIYNKILPGGIYIEALKGPDYPVKSYLKDLKRLETPWNNFHAGDFIFVGRKKDV